jgi:hypothetical protein
MHLSIKVITAIAVSLSLPPGVAQAQCAATKNLHGVWKGNDDGKYSIRVNGADVWWIGDGPGFKNVFKGVRKGRIVTGEWVDVVRSAGQSFNSGRLELELLGEGEFITAIRKKSSGGDGFGASQWTRPCNDN